MERGQGGLHHGAGDERHREGRGGGADALLPVPEEVAGGHGGLLAGPEGGEQRDTGARRGTGLVQDDVVLLSATTGTEGLLPHQDQCQPHDEGRPAVADAVRAGVL